jgi:elongation factor P
VASLIDAINIKRRTVFEHENVPYACLDSAISTPTARGGQTLVRLKIRNLLTGAVMDKTFKAGEKFKEPDMQLVPVSYLYSDADGSYFLDQDNFETLNLPANVIGDSLDLLVEGALIHMHKFNGNPIGVELPVHVVLEVAETEPGVKGDTASGGATKVAKLETGLVVRVPLFIKQGEKVKVATETREFAGRA